MTLRTRIVLYLVGVHGACAGIVAWLVRDSPAWLFAIEAGLVVSLAIGAVLAERTVRSLALGDEAARLIREGELASRLRPMGDGQVDRLIDVYNRMVDRLRAERVRVQEQQHFLEQVLGASPSGVVVLDFDGRVADLNPAAVHLLGVSRNEAIGLRVDDLASPLAAPLAALPPGATEVVGLTGTRRIRCHHGRFMDRGFPRAFLMVEELTEEARRFERAAYEKLIRVMSHEVNNTVTASNSLLQSSLTYAGELGNASRVDFEQALGIVIERTDQLNRFMRRFADVFRLPAPVRAPVDLGPLLEPIVRLLASRPEAAGIRWAWRLDEQTPPVDVDRGQFEQACLNIIKNAVEAAGPGGEVDVVLGVAEGSVVLAVEDSGAGPSDEAQNHLFTPFFSTKPNGQGIGLTLVQEILSAHGFGYLLEHPPGGPTRFVVTMSTNREGSARPDGAGARRPAPSGTRLRT